MLRWIICCTLLASGLLAQDQPVQPSAAGKSGFQISGVVQNSITGQPISHARVAIAPTTQRDFNTTIVTGEDGQFVFRNLAPGKYSMRAQRRGYLTRFFNQHDQLASAIAVGPELNSTNLIFHLPPECAISGRISDEAGEAVSNAEVSLYVSGAFAGEGGIHLLQRIGGDAEGFYHFGHLAPGKYFVVASGSPWYALRPQAQASGFSSITGPGGSAGVYSEAQGRSALDVAYPITFYPGVTEARDAAPIVLRDGSRFVADIALQPVPALHMRIPAEGGSRPSFVQLESRVFGATPIVVHSEMHTPASGDLEVVGIAPGHYHAKVMENRDGNLAAAKAGEVDATSDDVSFQHETQLVTVEATVQLDSGTTAPLHGNLQLSNSQTGDQAQEQVSQAGQIDFKARISPGRYQLTFVNTSGEFIKAASADGASLSGRSLDVKNSGSLKLNVTIARGEGSISGVVLREGKPMMGALVVLVPADPAHNGVLFRRDQSDSDGTFTLPLAVPGKYTLVAIENGWELEWLNPAVLKPYLAGGETVEVQPGGKYSVKLKVQ